MSDETYQIEHRQDIQHCPACGAETTHDVTGNTHHVRCPDHGEVTIA